MNWQPQEAGLTQLISVLADFQSHDNRVQRAAVDRLNQYAATVPDYFCYLAHIFANSTQLSFYQRNQAGLILKNNVLQLQQNVQFLTYIKHTALKAIKDPEEPIRNVAGTLITSIYSKDESQWPDLMPTLIALFDDPLAEEGAFNAVSKICEDSTSVLGSNEIISMLVPKLVVNMSSENVKIRRYTLNSCNQFILVHSPGFNDILPQFVQALYTRTNDPDPEVQKYLCQSFVMIAEVHIEILLPQLPNLINFILHVCQHEDEEVAREACEFWLVIAEHSVDRFDLEPLLPRLLPVLLKGMIYSENDMILLTGNENDEAVVDRDQDIKPRHHKAKHLAQDTQPDGTPKISADPTGGADDDEEEEFNDDDDDDEAESWNLRKCSAAALDVLATVCENAMLPHLLPLLTSELNNPDWKHREAGILALGAVADGCFIGMAPHLSSVMPVLVKTLDDSVPLVRSITCWTIGRYSKWTVIPPEGVNHDEFKAQFFQPVLNGFLQRVLDGNKKVQEAACSALATLEEEARRELIPFIEPILRTLTFAFAKYQSRNMLILFDAIGTLADSVGSALNDPKFIEILMPPLLNKYSNLTDDDPIVFPLLECLTSVATALGTGFAPFVAPIWSRCLQMISVTLQQFNMHCQNPESYPDVDKDYVVVSLDLLSGIAQGMSTNVEPYLSQSNPPLLPLLFACLKDTNGEVRQSAYALLGDLTISAFNQIKPALEQIMPLIIEQIDPNVDISHSSACNNAAWSAGEIALQWRDEVKPYIQPLMNRLIPLLNNERLALKALHENAAITIGRLGIVSAAEVAPALPHFFRMWCTSLSVIRDNLEKESAFLGMCQMIELNPNGVGSDLLLFCDAVVRWNKPSVELHAYFRKILHGFKQMAGANWDQFIGAPTFPVYIRERLRDRYEL